MEHDTIVGMKAAEEVERQLDRVKDELVRLKGYYVPAIHDRYLLKAQREILQGRDADAIIAECREEAH